MSNPQRRRKVICSLLALLVSSGYASSSSIAALAVDATPPAATAEAGVGVTGAVTQPTPGAPAAPSATSAISGTATTVTPGTAASPNPPAVSKTDVSATTDSTEVGAAPKMMFKPGQTLSTATDTEDIVATYDIDLANRQCAAYPDSAEAAFILAVALTRTSRVEDSLKQVQHARRLAESHGGPVYFDKMIASYEEMLKNYPDDNQVRYGLAWAYYMKAYLLGQQSRRSANYKRNVALVAASKGAATAGGAPLTTGAKPLIDGKEVSKALKGGDVASLATLATAAMALAGNQNLPPNSLPHIPTALENVEAADVPSIKHYYELALVKLDEIVSREPNDISAIVYRAHLKAEYTDNIDEAMTTWRAVEAKYPNNPAPHFFLGEGYLKKGNLKESINHVSKAIALRALGN